MATKPFEQASLSQSSAIVKPKMDGDVKGWERKQRLKEYRTAARREKRNRKSDEKKQRKLNMTILRRMTRNPEKYNKNAARNRLRAIEAERRKIQMNAVFMAQRLAAVHDPTGVKFNVKPVTTLEDGRVVTLESLERKKEREFWKQAKLEVVDKAPIDSGITIDPEEATNKVRVLSSIGTSGTDQFNPERVAMAVESKMPQKFPPGLSKTQRKKMEQYVPRPPPPKPTIPEGIEVPKDEPENWLELWDLPDEQLERRILRAKRSAARKRKELRIKQKSGKAERRAARDEKRRVYKEMKQSWKVLREKERTRRKFLVSMEEEERKKLATEVTIKYRRDAMKACEELGFTLQNVRGVTEIKPRPLGMKGVEIDFAKLEYIGDTESGLRLIGKAQKRTAKAKGNRVDLGAIAPESMTQTAYGPYNTSGNPANLEENFVAFGDEGGHEHQQLNFNHRLRRKLRRAMEAAQVEKELLVREAAVQHCKEKCIEVPPILSTPTKPENIRGQRTMPDGTLETQKQERVRSRVELAEFNRNAKILRAYAKEKAVKAGITIYLELMGRIPKQERIQDGPDIRAPARMVKESGEEAVWSGSGIGGGQSVADLLASWPMPKDEFADYEEMHVYGNGQVDGPLGESSEDSAAKQLQAEMARSRVGDTDHENWGVSSSSEGEGSESEDENSDEEMSDAS